MSENQNQNQNQGGVPRAKVYWTPASRFSLANFRPEERYQNGMLKQAEVSLDWNENIKVTADPAEIDFIEKSDAFRNGLIIKCKDVEEARKKTAMQKIAKRGRIIQTEVNEKVDLSEAEIDRIVG